jgi:hypothetical protein
MNLFSFKNTEQEYAPPYYWSQDDWNKIHSQNNLKLEDLFEISLKVVRQIQNNASPTGLVIGPMMTGGYDPVKNLEIFEAAIQTVRLKGVAVFNQLHLLPFLDFYTYEYQSKNGLEQYPCEIMTELFLPLIKQANFDRIFVIEGWESSKGARLEMTLCQKIDLIPEIIPLSKIRQFLA